MKITRCEYYLHDHKCRPVKPLVVINGYQAIDGKYMGVGETEEEAIKHLEGCKTNPLI